MKRTFLLLLSFAFIFNVFSAERFWVNGTGNWDNKSHWSATSGGTAGASIPTSNDDVIFDSKSFPGDGNIISINGFAQCHHMVWKKTDRKATFSCADAASLTVFGSLAFSPAIKNEFRGKLIFRSSENNNTIYTANKIIYGDVIFDGESGEWKLLDALTVRGDIHVMKGIFNGNNQTIHCRSVIRPTVSSRGLMVGFSKIVVKEGWKTSELVTQNPASEKSISYVFPPGNFKKENTHSATTTTVTCTTGTVTLTLALSGTDPLCNGDANGFVSVNVSGGVSPYTYIWTPGAYTTSSVTGLLANTYVVEIWDKTGINYCNGSIGIANPPSLIVNITPPSPVTSCFGLCDGAATQNGIGGTAPYTYLWNTVPAVSTGLATGLCASTYSATVTDVNGCVKVKQVVIGQPALLVANGSSTNIKCFGNCDGVASVSPSGGNIPYTYSWAPGGAKTPTISNLCPGTFTCTVTDTKSCVATYITTITQPPVLSTTVTGTNLVCNGVCTGSVSATASGGSGLYTYSWAPGGYTTSSVTGLCAGTYSLTLADGNGCVKTKTITLTQPAAITTVQTGKNITCFSQCNGSVTSSAGGGTSPYTYLWAPGGCSTSSCSNLCKGTYTVTVNDISGCAVTGTITLTEPALLSANTTKTDVTCNGSCNGGVTATVTGGTAPYTYLWSPGGRTTSACSGLCAGTYSVLVTDSKTCTATSIIAVNSPAVLLPNLSSTPTSCFGNCNGHVFSSPSGGTAPYTYNWSPGGCTTSSCSNLCAGNYTLTLTDAHACTASGTVSVSQPNTFIASVSSATPNPLNCNGDCNGTAIATLNGGTAPYTFSWSTGATTPSVTGLCAGPYTLSCTDVNGCVANTGVTFFQPTILNVTPSSSNPACSGGCNGSISAIAGGGTPAYTFAWLPGGQTTSVISSLCAGTYHLKVTDKKGCTNTQTVTLTSPTTVVANASIIKNASCSGSCNGVATAAPSGGTPPYSYLWTGGGTNQTISGLCAGIINVTVTDANGCSNIGILTITQPGILTSSIGSTTSSCTLCTGTASVLTSGGTSPYSFFWTPGGQTSSTAVALCAGNYSVSITDAQGCTNSLRVTINPVVTLTITVSGTSVSCPGSCDGIASATPFGGTAPYSYQWSTNPIQISSSATGLCAGSYTVTVGDVNGCVNTNALTFSSPTALTSTLSSTAASCGLCNGTASATLSGGTGAYTYSWSGFPVQTTATATGLCTGNYSVTVSDANNCTTTNTVSVGNIPAISDNASVTLAACGASNGAICVAPAGGTPPYTYLWSPSGATISCITGLAVGIYTVTVSDAVGCSNRFPIALSNIAGPTVTVTSAINPSCYSDCNGSISVSVAGSNPPYNYAWNPSGQTTAAISALCAGTYIVRVTDNTPCTTFSSTTLTGPTQIKSNPTVSNVSCKNGNNGSICLSPSGGTSPYTFTWKGGQTTACVTGLAAGTYTVILADAKGCDDTIAIPISEPAALTISISATPIACNGNANGTATALVTGGTTLYTYAWSTGSPLSSIVGLGPGNYSITVTDNNGCASTATVAITDPPALTTALTSSNITCNAACNGTVTLTALGGTTAYTYSWLPGGQTLASVTGLCIGNYVGTVTDANGCSSTKTVTLTQPSAISVNVTYTNTSCYSGCNGLAASNVSGGTGPYTYQWNPGGQTSSSVSGLCAGSYSLVTSDASGCNAASLFPITEPALLQANITNTPTSCPGTCDGTASSSPMGGTGPYTYLWNTAQTSANVSGLCVGIHTLTLSDAKGCTVSQTTNIISPTPLTQGNGVTGATCLLCNGSITVTGAGGTSPYSYFWSNGATTATITGLCAGVYIDTVIDAKGCMSFDTLAVNNTSGPVITLSGTNVTCFGYCNGTATVSSANGNGPPWVYSWAFPTTTQTTQTITGLCPQQYFATVTDIAGCKTIDKITITEPTPLVSNAVATNATCFGICDGSIATSTSGGTGAYTYNWLPGGQTIASLTAQCAGTYTLALKDANNCPLTTTVTIGQNTILTSTLTSTNNVCNAACTGAASITVAGGTLPYTYLWTAGGQTTTTATGLCAGNYTVTVNTAIGCLSIDTFTITQPTALLSNITEVNPFCNGSCNGSLSSAPTGGVAPYSYLWNPGGATTATITGLCAGTFTLTLSDANNCVSTTPMVVTDPLILSSTYVVTKANCLNTCDGNIDITPSGGTGAYSFTWSPAGQTTEDVTGLCPGIYSVIIKDIHGCPFTDSMTVNATTPVIAHAGKDTSFCLGGTAALTSASTNATSIKWYQLPAWAFIGSANPVTVSPPAGNTSYALIAFNGSCADTDWVTVTVNNYPIVLANSATICSGGSASICASGANTYQWYQLPAWTPVATGACMNVTPGVAGITNYSVIGMNGVCSDTGYASISVLAMPVADAGNDTAVCFGSSLTLCNRSINSTLITWYTLPAWTKIDTTSCITINPPAGANEFALIVYNGSCSDTDTVSVTVYATPPVDAGTNVTVLPSIGAVLNGTGNGTFLWSPAAGLSNTTIANPNASPTVTTTYTLLVTDANGCTATDTVRVTIISNVIPNDGISPNGDGKNDFWIIPNIEQFPEALVEVYNRWGEVVFHSVGYSQPWDGKYKNKNLPVGTYYYIINLNSDLYKDPITGPITILR